ncbi:MAG: hypothetical protein IJA78_05950 [Clostridia bacterium]|nr:hypothetical protein [Clostridia bacterium]
MKIRIAELNIEIQNRYPYTARQCVGYEAEFDRADITVCVPIEDVKREFERSVEGCSPGYAEFICIYRAIARELPRFGAFVFHASVVECDGRAYAFTATSGTGKSTHTALWLQEFGARARIINGDKPIFRFFGDTLYACGTPWCGKERQGCNAVSPLAALCFLERDTVNRIAPIDDAEAVKHLFHQIFIPESIEAAGLLFDLLDRTVRNIPTYLLGCNISPEAAHVAYRGMQRGENE